MGPRPLWPSPKTTTTYGWSVFINIWSEFCEMYHYTVQLWNSSFHSFCLFKNLHLVFEKNVVLPVVLPLHGNYKIPLFPRFKLKKNVWMINSSFPTFFIRHCLQGSYIRIMPNATWILQESLECLHVVSFSDFVYEHTHLIIQEPN